MALDALEPQPAAHRSAMDLDVVAEAAIALPDREQRLRPGL